jgi:tRNA threonylcarbamoyladenosine biosynthesis protein TsaB
LKILLIDSSSKNVEFGYFNGEKLYEKKLNRESTADSLIYEIKEDFTRNGFKFSEIEYVSLSNGPGSFTGLRIGSAIAKGICFGLGARLVEVITLDIIANKVSSDKVIVPLIFSNMKSEEFYYNGYVKTDNVLKHISGYKIGRLESIDTEGKVFVINEPEQKDLLNERESIDVSGLSSMQSQLELTLQRIEKNLFSDITVSEPFYIKSFEPLKTASV